MKQKVRGNCNFFVVFPLFCLLFLEGTDVLEKTNKIIIFWGFAFVRFCVK